MKSSIRSRFAVWGIVLPLVALLVSLSWGGNAEAALYKWVDEKGVIHMTDSPPDDAIMQKYKIEGTETVDVADREKEPEKGEPNMQLSQAKRQVTVYTTPT